MSQAGIIAGDCYRQTIAHVKAVLADPKKYHPAYDPEAGYDLAGFVWFQGYNDYIGKSYPSTDESLGQESPKDYSEYTRLLAASISMLQIVRGQKVWMPLASILNS